MHRGNSLRERMRSATTTSEARRALGSMSCSAERKMPSRQKIAKWWAGRFNKKGWEIDWEIVHNSQCFACGRTRLRLERAHIMPRCKGGNDSVQNLHILCVSCHAESEYLYGLKYWRWYRHKRYKEFNDILFAEIERELAINPSLKQNANDMPHPSA